MYSSVGTKSAGRGFDLMNRYQVGHVIGDGTYGTVMLAFDKQNGEQVSAFYLCFSMCDRVVDWYVTSMMETVVDERG